MDRVWKGHETGDVGVTTLSMSGANQTALQNDSGLTWYLLQDDDGSDFTDATVVTGTWTASGITFTYDHDAAKPYFTFATSSPEAPGGVSANLRLWLKSNAGTFSDAGVTAAGSGDQVQQWHDQSGNSYVSDATASNGPVFTQNRFNFNPTLDNNAANGAGEITGGIFGGETVSEVFVYAVANTHSTANAQFLFFREYSWRQRTICILPPMGRW